MKFIKPAHHVLAGALLIAVAACGGPELTLATSAGDPLTASELNLEVRETAGVARNREIVRSGVPLPRALDVRSLGGIAVVDAAGVAVPAEFEVLARWNAGKGDLNAPIQWLLVTFASDAVAHGAAHYRLSVDGSKQNPAPARPINLVQAGSRVTVDTGAATFVIDGASNTLFQEVRAGPTIVATAGPQSGTVDGRAVRLSALRRVSIEHQGPLSAIVVVEGSYDFPATGGGGLGSRLRYQFTAGSPTAIVRHSAAFEGDKCGAGILSCGAGPNGLLTTRLEDALALSLPAARTVQAIGARSRPAVSGSAALGAEAWVRQKLRPGRTSPRAYEVSAAGATDLGVAADGAILAISGGGNTVAIALDHMHDYEPQAVRLKTDGSLAIDVVDDKAWIGARQGIFGTFAITAATGVSTRPELERLTWAPLNAPLRAWPSNKVFSDSHAVGDLPNGVLSSNLVSYDTLTQTVLDDTLARREERGIFGVSVFGSVPRYWGRAQSPDELDCGADPTPSESWDNMYWCGTFTDYHNGMNQVAQKAMRTGAVEYLDELEEPAALRVLHTQILQCAPGDSNFYCGQAPMGYGGFRADFNSSHAYFANLTSYYWLTGDKTVVETIQRGARTMRNYVCARRPAASCGPTDLPSDQWASLTGRVASQWYAAFRFVGLASDDATFLDDYRQGVGRAMTQNYLEGVRGGVRYGFWTGTPVSGAGTYSTDQLWMASIYDLEMVNQLRLDTNDAPFGSPAIPPSRVMAAWAQTLADFAPTVMGNGTASAVMPNALRVVTTGSRLDGALVSVSADTSGSDPTLYDAGKTALAGVLARTGHTALATALAQNGIAAATALGAPIGKEEALFLAQLGPAVAVLGSSNTPTPTPTPTPPPTKVGTLLYSTMDSPWAVATPAVGPTGTLSNIGPSAIRPGALGNAIYFSKTAVRASYPLASPDIAALLHKGEISFSLKPSYGAGDADDLRHTFVVIGDLSNPPALLLEESDTLSLTYVDANWASHSVRSRWRAPVFSASTWATVVARWSSTSADSMQIFVDGTRVDTGGLGPFAVAPARSTLVTIGADNYGGYGASASLDELRISSSP